MGNKYKLGSLFDGSGGFPLAGAMCGIEPVWASEVEPYPIAVTRSRFPSMKHLGDISKVNGAEIEPVDIITFGSPCQDLSVAGKRAGLKHEANGDEETTRSGLFMEAVRIIKEMRSATNGEYPSFALWENVPGAFSSNKGEDFRLVCEELIKIVEPAASMPEVPKNGWPYADSYCGDGWSLAYRVFDAQYWGVPQRRRRIHLVLDLRGARAREVLFEREGVRGYFAQGRTPWQAAARDAQDRAGADDRAGEYCDGYNGVYAVDQGGGKSGANVHRNLSPTLTCTHGGEPAVAYAIERETTSGGFCPEQSAKTRGIGWEEEMAPTLRAGVVPGVVTHKPVPYTLKIRSIDRPAVAYSINHQGGNVEQVIEGITGTLTAAMNTSGNNKLSVAYAMQGFGDYKDCGVASGLKARDYKDATDLAVEAQPIAIDRAYFNQGQNAKYDPQLYTDGTNPTLVARGPSAVAVRYIVRRLTPTECARLQGFADRWGDIDEKDNFTPEEYNFWQEVRNTHAAINGKKVQEYTEAQMLRWYNKLHTDSAEYKMWGNGIALPPALYCMQGIVDALENAYAK